MEPLKVHNLVHFGEEKCIFFKENNTITWSLIIHNYFICDWLPLHLIFFLKHKLIDSFGATNKI